MMTKTLAAVAVLGVLGLHGSLAAAQQSGSGAIIGPRVVIPSDGRTGGSFWQRPIRAVDDDAVDVDSTGPLAGPTLVIPSDGRPGGAFWGRTRTVERWVARAGAANRFTGAAHVDHRPYRFLEDYNP